MAAHLIRRLAEVGPADVELVGGKAARLGQLLRAGFRVPDGFVLTTEAYELFLREGRLETVVRMELGRKDPADMRWEELWDAALRIRAAFARAPLPPALTRALAAAPLPPGLVAVRSSAPGEDGALHSFAGLHASLLDRRGRDEVLAATRTVWASLWSDMALLYRRELGLDPLRSRMAVVVQGQVQGAISGVAFGRDPRAPLADRLLIEAVAGPCAGLVDGSLDPDHYVLERSSGRLLSQRRGEGAMGDPLLSAADLAQLHALVVRVEGVCGWPADVEWTGEADAWTLLQARPAGAVAALPDDRRRTYLDYCPGPQQLERLRTRVVDELIPELAAEGTRLARVAVEALADDALADALEERARALERWRRVYEEAFIPFAHGVRALGLFYNDALQPADPHEFVGLLWGERFLASERNDVLTELGALFAANPSLRAAASERLAPEPQAWGAVTELLVAQGAGDLAARLQGLLGSSLDVVYEGLRLVNRPDLVLGPLVASGPSRASPSQAPTPPDVAALRAGLLQAIGPEREQEAERVLEVARLSWRLRDDDNLLLGRIESQLLRGVEEGARRLRAAARLKGRSPGLEESRALVAALRSGAALSLAERPAAAAPTPLRAQPRQLVGQPASPGLGQGLARRVRTPADLATFRPGEVLVCDAIQPQMTHLVPLAAAVIERRGGMLIHGAIIARELGIPCVNGVQAATDLLSDGLLLTVDGDLGLVTVGEAGGVGRPRV